MKRHDGDYTLREVFEFRIHERFASLLSRPNAGKLLGRHIRQVVISAKDPLFAEIGMVDSQLYASERRHLFSFWHVQRRYTSTEIESAELFRMMIRATFEPAGEECGTQYDESRACDICGSGAAQASDLFLDLRKVPNRKDIVRTIADEWIVSGRLAEILGGSGIRGVELRPVRHCGEYGGEPVDLRSSRSGRQLLARARLEGVSLQARDSHLWICRPENRALWEAARSKYVADRQAQERVSRKSWPEWRQLVVASRRLPIVPPTRTGDNPFDNEPEGRHRCPRGDNIGHTYLSEVYVQRNAWDGADIMLTRETTGPRRGLLRPSPEILVTPRLRKLLIDNKIKGADFEISHFV